MLCSVLKDEESCVGCNACYCACNFNAIKLTKDKGGFFYPKINIEKCIQCGQCHAVCPVENKKFEDSKKCEIYVCQNKDNIQRKNSSSGGVFSALAEYVLEREGYVFGAMYDEKFRVYHGSINKKSELKKLQGSKYVQSDMGTIFLDVLQKLKSNKYVLFSGTPCQVEALKKFLKKEYDNLITMDFVCHGVPSPLIFKRYLSFIEKKFNKKIKNVYFRDKSFGYASSTMAIEFNDGKFINSDADVKSYKRMYFKGLISRKACYNCKFKAIKHNCDFTVFDCWSMNRFNKVWDDDKGSSYVIVQSNKGRQILQEISKLRLKRINLEKIISSDAKMLINSDIENPQRDNLMMDINLISYKDILNKYCKASCMEIILNKVKPYIYKTGIIRMIKRIKN